MIPAQCQTSAGRLFSSTALSKISFFFVAPPSYVFSRYPKHHFHLKTAVRIPQLLFAKNRLQVSRTLTVQLHEVIPCLSLQVNTCVSYFSVPDPFLTKRFNGLQFQVKVIVKSNDLINLGNLEPEVFKKVFD